MCGIAGIHRRGDALVPNITRLADTLLLAIEERGTDATGVLAMLPDGKVQLDRKTIPARQFVSRRRKKWSDEARTILLHTRFATVGKADDVRNAHPVINGRMAAVHNGTIYNHAELTRTFGLKRHAEVDSEVIPALASEAGWENLAEAFDLFRGGAAFALVNADKPEELVLARTQSYPLCFYVTDDAVVWASTRWAIERAWAMTYGEPPTAGTFHHLGEWTMVRVNGKLTETAIRERKPLFTRPLSAAGGKAKAGKRSKKSKATKGRAKPAPIARQPISQVEQLPAFMEREPWMEDEVRALQRDGLSYADAFDAVYGILPDTEWSPDSWLETSWR